MMADKKDPRPNYYNRGGVECQDVIEAWELNFSLGSAMKYICRAGFKADAIEDLKKARQYLTFEIERRESGTTRAGPGNPCVTCGVCESTCGFCDECFDRLTPPQLSSPCTACGNHVGIGKYCKACSKMTTKALREEFDGRAM